MNYYSNENWQRNKIVNTFVEKYAEEVRKTFTEHPEVKDFKERNMDKIYAILQNSLKEMHNSNLEEAKMESNHIKKKYRKLFLQMH